MKPRRRTGNTRLRRPRYRRVSPVSPGGMEDWRVSCVARVELVCYSLQSALARPRIPIGRGSSLKICAVWVRVPPRAPKSPGHTASRWRGANCSLRAFSYSRHRLASRCSVDRRHRRAHGTPHYQVQHYVAPDNELIMKLHYQPRHVVEADNWIRQEPDMRRVYLLSAVRKTVFQRSLQH